MSFYINQLLVEDRICELQREAKLDRLARTAAAPRRRWRRQRHRWWGRPCRELEPGGA